MKASIHAGAASEAGPAGERSDPSAFVSIAPFFRLLSRYHRVLLLGLAGLALTWVAGVLLLRAVLPGVTTSSIGIRFAFQGVSVGQYPNGLRFSPNDVIAPEILEQVYIENSLKDILSFERFKKSVFITQSNRALDQLESEYAIKLRDSRLSAPERRQLEKEFLAASEGLRTDSYLIKYRGDGDSRLPEQLYEQVLLAIPATWAQLAAERRGVLSYDIEIGTAAPVAQPGTGTGTDDILQAVEFLRLTSTNLRGAAYLVAELPGANLARGDGGETVADLTTELDVFNALTVMPLYVTGIRLAAANEPAVVESVLASRVESERRVKAAADGKASDLERALQFYVANAVSPEVAGTDADGGGSGGKGGASMTGGSGVIAQVGGGFIDDIIRTRDAAQDIKYRQELNDKVVAAKMKAVEAAANVEFAAYALEQVRHPSNAGPGRDADRFAAQAKAAGERMRDLSAKLHVLYERISQRNLNPGSTLYMVDRPLFSVHTAGVAWSNAVLGGFGFITLGMIGLVAACAAYDRRTAAQAD
jgi:hypothetical protein